MDVLELDFYKLRKLIGDFNVNIFVSIFPNIKSKGIFMKNFKLFVSGLLILNDYSVSSERVIVDVARQA